VFIMQFDMGVFLRQELTSSRKKLDDILPFVDTPTRRELQAQSGAGTRLYDAVEKASREIMSHQSGRKALIVLSDGVDNGSEASLALAIEVSDVPVTKPEFRKVHLAVGGKGLVVRARDRYWARR